MVCPATARRSSHVCVVCRPRHQADPKAQHHRAAGGAGAVQLPLPAVVVRREDICSLCENRASCRAPGQAAKQQWAPWPANPTPISFSGHQWLCYGGAGTTACTMRGTRYEPCTRARSARVRRP
jgi:hypothetical protein